MLALVAESFVPMRLMSPAFVVIERSSPAVNSERIFVVEPETEDEVDCEVKPFFELEKEL